MTRNLTLTLLALLLLAPVSQVYADTYYRIKGVASDDALNVRERNTFRSKKVGTIPPDGQCILEQRCKKNWCLIRYKTLEGWVNSKYLALMKTPQTCMPEPPPADTVEQAKTASQVIEQPREPVETAPEVTSSSPETAAEPTAQAPAAAVEKITDPASSDKQPVETQTAASEEKDETQAETATETPEEETTPEQPVDSSIPDLLVEPEKKSQGDSRHERLTTRKKPATNGANHLINVTKTICSKQLLESDDPEATIREAAASLFKEFKLTTPSEESQRPGDPLVHLKALSDHGRIFAEYYGRQSSVVRCSVTLIPFDNLSTIHSEDIDRRIELAMRMQGRTQVASSISEEPIDSTGAPIRTTARYYGANCEDINIKTAQSSIRNVTRVSTIMLALSGSLPPPKSGCETTASTLER